MTGPTQPATPGADVVILGAPFDGGTSHRSGTRFGPQHIRQTCYLPHDGSRPSLALRVDGLQDLRVFDAGDVEMFSGDAAAIGARPAGGGLRGRPATGAIPLILGGDHTIAWPDAAGVAQHLGQGRVSMIHFDAHADTGNIEFGSLIGHGQPMRRLIESGALRGDRFLQIGLRGYWPEPETLGWMAEQGMRSYEMTEIVARGLDECLTEAFAIATDDCDGVFLSVDIDVCDPGHAPGTGTPEPGGLTARQLLDAVRRICLRAAGGRHRRGRGVAALRPRRDHVVPRQPGRARGAVRHRPPAPRRGRRHHLGPAPAAAGRSLTGDTVDAVIVGAGPNGLAAAITLAQAGLEVAVYEAAETVGGGARTEELTLPGFRHDPCSAVHPLGAGSPVLRSWPLTEHGLTWIQPDLPLAHPFLDGPAVTLARSVEETADSLGPDGRRYRRLVRPFLGRWDELASSVLRAPLDGLPPHPLLLAGFGYPPPPRPSCWPGGSAATGPGACSPGCRLT